MEIMWIIYLSLYHPNIFSKNQTPTKLFTAPELKKITAKIGSCEVTSPFPIPKTKFSKISITCCKANLLKLYINYNLVNATSCSNTPSSTSPIYVAGSPSGNYFKGIIDEIRISNSSLPENLITYFNSLNVLFYNPSKQALKGFYILAKISGKNILSQTSQSISQKALAYYQFLYLNEQQKSKLYQRSVI